MQRSTEIRELYAFNHWANTRTLAAVAELSNEAFARDLKSSHGGVRGTLLHVMASEWVWLARWLGTSPTATPAEWQDYDRAQIDTEWGVLFTAQSAFVGQLADHELDRVVRYTNFKGENLANPLWQLLRHMVNHSSYHRGQVTTMLRQLGHTPQATDLVLYYRLQQQVAPSP